MSGMLRCCHGENSWTYPEKGLVDIEESHMVTFVHTEHTPCLLLCVGERERVKRERVFVLLYTTSSSPMWSSG